MKNIAGMRFGRLVAENVHHSVGHRRFWYCRCDCGSHAVVRQDQLTTQKTKSCGCVLDESRIKNLSKGRSKKGRKDRKRRINGHNANWNPLKHQQPRLYRIWQSMKSRCCYEKNKCYSSYGGRGISVCDEWLRSFNAFAEWAITNGYEDHLSIDRIDVDGNYHPDNCRWITMAEQQKNKRKAPRQNDEGHCRSDDANIESGKGN